VEQRIAHYRDTKALRAENDEMKVRTWRLEKELAQLKEAMEQKSKRMEKYAGARRLLIFRVRFRQFHLQIDWRSTMFSQKTPRQATT
jgi:hypothetical protein